MVDLSDYKLLVFSYFLVLSNGLPTTPPKSVNLAVETSFLFEPEDVHNATVLGNVRQFLNKLENLLNPGENGEPVFRTDVKVDKDEIDNDKNDKNENDDKKKGKNVNGSRLTTFLAELGGIVINFNDDEMKSLAKALNDEVVRNYVSNPKFHEMIQNIPMKLFIKNTVKEWTTTDPLKLKVEIAKYIISDEGSAFVTFFQNLNQFFENDKAKLKKLVKKFAKARKTRQFEKPLEKILDLMFERFEKFDDNSKMIFRDEIEKLTKYITVNYKSRLGKDDEHSRRALSNTTLGDLFESVKDELKNNENSIETPNVKEIRLDKNMQVSVHANNDPNVLS